MLAFAGVAASAETLRIATFGAPLSRDGPGLLLRDIERGEDPQIAASLAVIDHIGADILVLTEFDHDLSLMALTAFNQQLSAPYEHVFALPSNAGMPTGLDLDGNGRLGEPRDAQGYGRFSGDGAIAVLSRLPVLDEDVVDHSAVLWRDLPGAVLPQLEGAVFPSEDVIAVQRLSSTGHWQVPVQTDAGRLTLMVFAATPPVFDGPEDRNGLRNRDELRLWENVLAGWQGGPFVVAGNFNLDPADGEGDRDAIAAFLTRQDLTDPRPTSVGARQAADPDHRGDPALDTADWSDDGPGSLRVSYVLPSADLTVLDAGVFWPGRDDPLAPLLGEDGNLAGPHRLVWVDIELN